MFDFKSQIESGLRAHRKANKDKTEIRSVFNDLSQQLSESTENKVGITVQKDPAAALRDAISKFGKGFDTSELLRERQAIFIFNKKFEGAMKKIADWEMSDTGYPCSLRFYGENIDCFDRASLEQALGKLVSTSEAGRAIFDTMNFAPPRPEPNKA